MTVILAVRQWILKLAIDYMVSVLKPETIYAKKFVRGMGELQVENPEIKQAELV